MSEINKFELTLECCENTLKKLIQVDTCQPNGNEKDIIKIIQDMIPANVKSTVFEHGANRASLLVEIEGQQDCGGVAFLGHVDTVACNDLAEWNYYPLHGVVEGDLMYGRGTADMKGGVAAMILTMHEILHQKTKPKVPIYFGFTADEESQGMGILEIMRAGVLDSIQNLVICEPSDEKIGIAEKGALWLQVKMHGISAHGSRPEIGINAIEHGISLVDNVKKILLSYGEDSVLGQSTVSITKMQGGIMTNMIPSDAIIELDIRTIPEVKHPELLEKLQRYIEKQEEKHIGLKIDIKIMNDRPAIGNEKKDSFVSNMYSVSERCGISTEVKGLKFYTDASQVVPILEVPFVIAGPGDDAMAHKTNESVSLKSVLKFSQLYSNYIKEYCL